MYKQTQSEAKEVSPGKTILSLKIFYHLCTDEFITFQSLNCRLHNSLYCSRFGRMGHVNTNGKPQKIWNWNINLFTHFDRSNSIRSYPCGILDKEVSIDVED